MNERLLGEVGLTKGEIKVYLTLLKTGQTTTGKIIKEAQISSGKIYEILEKLIKKGLVSYIIKEKTRYFGAASPNRILDYLNEKEDSLRKKRQEIIKELPSLIAREKEGKKEYEANLFKGFKGIQTAIFEASQDLTSKNEILAMGIVSEKAEQYNILWQKWHKERIKKKIKCRAIFSDKKIEYYKLFKKMKLTQVKILEGITPTAVDIMKDRILILTYGIEPSCLSIRNFEVAQSFTTFFNNLWNKAKL